MNALVAQGNKSGPIPFIDLQAQRRRLGSRVNAAVNAVIDHGQYILGPEVKLFEQKLAAHCGAKHVIGCANGTDAIVLALMALGVVPNDAVFCPSFTFAATAEAVALVGATPVFVDVDAVSYNMSARSLEAAVAMVKKDGKLKPVGVIAVDLFGQPADYRVLDPIARDADLWVISDAAQSYGAKLDNRSVGTMAPLTTTSFFPAKPLGCYGDGGAIFTDDDKIAALLRSLLVHGQGTDKYDNIRIGMNGRLDTIQAAILLEKLGIFDDEIERRQAVADRYAAGLRDVVEVPRLMSGMTSVWAQYTIQTDKRDALVAGLKTLGIPTAIYYPKHLQQQTAYRTYPVVTGGLPVSDMAATRVLSLPMHPYLDVPTQDRIIQDVRDVLRS
jgi:dTDP-4-amino-4,6-dideoxygalactose transaminase